MTSIALQENLLNNYLFGCAENLGADTFDIALLLYSETLASVITISETWYFDFSV